jgi:hypothetical protein
MNNTNYKIYSPKIENDIIYSINHLNSLEDLNNFQKSLEFKTLFNDEVDFTYIERSLVLLLKKVASWKGRNDPILKKIGSLIHKHTLNEINLMVSNPGTEFPKCSINEVKEIYAFVIQKYVSRIHDFSYQRDWIKFLKLIKPENRNFALIKKIDQIFGASFDRLLSLIEFMDSNEVVPFIER